MSGPNPELEMINGQPGENLPDTRYDYSEDPGGLVITAYEEAYPDPTIEIPEINPLNST